MVNKDEGNNHNSSNQVSICGRNAETHLKEGIYTEAKVAPTTNSSQANDDYKWRFFMWYQIW